MPKLNRGEQIVRQEPAKWLVGGKSSGSGELFLTNQRLIYEIKGKGGLFKGGTPQTALDAPLPDIDNVTESKPTIPIPLVSSKVLLVEYDKRGFEFGVKQPGMWKTIIFSECEKCQMTREEEERKQAQLGAEERRRTEIEQKEHEMAVARTTGEASAPSIHIGQVGASHTEVTDSVVGAKAQIGAGGPSTEGGTCPACGGAIQPGWKACPGCGAQIPSGCPHCGASIQSGWKACPACGNAL